ncbi:MAG: response regulator transcription factor [Candidatus Eremiobacteraeota bacterium]|nr:response regulator transcription factor [Candidatus Eremiobacteraeota bacterium]MCL5054353.1 response regulator transcription factor [Bacillota bacterium]
MKGKILLVDDEQTLTDALTYLLSKEGFQVICASSGSSALQKTFQENPDLIILDIMLPEIDGYEVCRTIRAKGFLKPVLLISAKDEEVDKIVGLEVGADDYVTKPFSTKELIARVRAHLRRDKRNDADFKKSKNQIIKIGGLEIFPGSREVFLDSKLVPLSSQEYDLLFLLASNPDKVLTHDQILEKIWGYDFEGDSNVVQAAIKRLRVKLNENSLTGKKIINVRGIGYRFAGEKRL